MMDPYPTPLCFQPNHVSPPLTSSSSVLPTFPYPPAVSVPSQRVKRDIFRQSHAGTNTTSIKDGNSPSAEQCTAVAILQGIPDCTILAWLEGFRSLPRGEQWFDPHHLSHQQRQAVSALKDCTDNLVLTWLTFPPSPRQSPHCSYRPWLIVVIGALNASQNLHGNGNFSSDRLAANSLDQSPSSFSDLSRDAYVGKQSSPPTTSNCHDHWCFVCEDPRPITTCDGFKRHIREHEKRYYCVPRESVVVTEDVPRCAFCHDVSNPDLKHLNTHSVPECIGRKYTRKKTLIKHLEKNHGVDDGSVLAGQCEYTVIKKYFACGFCVSCFSSLQEQVNHIDAHYKSSKHIRDWDSDKVIRGLLSQPIVNEYWRSGLAEQPHLKESCFKWDPKLVKKLQRRLERSQEPADVLFAATIHQSNYVRSDAGFVGLTTGTSQPMQKFQGQDAWSPLPSSSNQDSTAYAHVLPPKTSTLQQQRQLTWDSIDLNNPRWDEIYGSRSLPQIDSETYGSSISMTHHHSIHDEQPWFSPNSDRSFMQQQHPALMSPIELASDVTQAWEDRVDTAHSSKLDGHSQGASPNLAANPRSIQIAQAHKYPAQLNMGGFHATLSTHFAPLPLSRNHLQSQTGQITGPFNSIDDQTPVAGPQGHELIDYYVADADVDTRNMQRIIRDQDHNRRQ